MEEQKHLLLIKEYSQSPGPRYTKQGDDSGEDFYYTKLNEMFYEALQDNVILTVELDGTDGFASSFLDEAFGNLVYDFGKDVVENHIKIISDEEPEWIEMLKQQTFVQWEKRRRNNEERKTTAQHDTWYSANGMIKKGDL